MVTELTIQFKVEGGERVHTLSFSQIQLLSEPNLRRIPFALIRKGEEEGLRIQEWFEREMGWKIKTYRTQDYYTSQR